MRTEDRGGMYRGGRRVLEVQQKQKDEGTITKEGRVRSRACSRKEERAPFANYPRRQYLTRDRWEAKRMGEGEGGGRERNDEKERGWEKERKLCVCVRAWLFHSTGSPWLPRRGCGWRSAKVGWVAGLVVHETALTPPRLRTPDPLQRWPTSCWRSDCRIARGTLELWIPPCTAVVFRIRRVRGRLRVDVLTSRSNYAYREASRILARLKLRTLPPSPPRRKSFAQ